jgi:MFS family permease
MMVRVADQRRRVTFTPPAPQTRYRPGTARAALAYRNYRLIWLGLFASNTGTWMQNFILPAYVDDRTRSATLVGLLVFTQLGPLLVLSIPAGILADKLPRKPFLITLQLLQMLLTIIVAGLVAIDAALWTLFMVQLSIGIANALNAPAFQASVPLMVARQDLAGAVSLNSVMINASRVLGPALAAVLAGIGFSTSQLFMVNAATYLFLIAAMLAVLIPDVRGTHPEQGWRRLLTGINIARGRPVLARVLVTMMLFSLFSLVYIGLFPSVTRLNLGIDVQSATYKWLYASWGLGAAIGALSISTFLSRFDRLRMIVIGFVGFAISLAIFALLSDPLPAFPVSFVLGGFYFMTATALVTTLQVNVRDTERASVMPLWFMVFGGTVPIGNLLFGPVVDAFGARGVMLFGAAFALVLARWCDLRRFPPDDFLDPDEPHEPTDTAPVRQHGIVAGG